MLGECMYIFVNIVLFTVALKGRQQQQKEQHNHKNKNTTTKTKTQQHLQKHNHKTQIVDMLSAFHSITMSVCTLKTQLREAGLYNCGQASHGSCLLGQVSCTFFF